MIIAKIVKTFLLNTINAIMLRSFICGKIIVMNIKFYKIISVIYIVHRSFYTH